MPALNFSACFAPMVESGKKRQTIRKRRKRPIKKGDRLYLYTGLRTKRARKLGEAVCQNVVPVRIESENAIFLNGHQLSDVEALELAQKDGILNTSLFVFWFDDLYGLPFDGDLIQW